MSKTKETKKNRVKRKIKKGDYVQIISGDDKGERGRVLRILTKTNRVVVEGYNYVFRHVRKSQKNPQGGRIQKEAPIHISNVKVYEPPTGDDK